MLRISHHARQSISNSGHFMHSYQRGALHVVKHATFRNKDGAIKRIVLTKHRASTKLEGLLSIRVESQ
jgi:hypothetical protein